MSLSLPLFLSLACAARSHDLPDRVIFNDEDNFADIVVFGDKENFSDEESFRACVGEGVGVGEEEKERDISLKYREMVPAMALTEPLYDEVTEAAAPTVVVGVLEVAPAVVSLVAAVLVSDDDAVTSACLFLAHARRTASLRNSDSAAVVGRLVVSK